VALAKPTLLIDEADTFLKDNQELRGILNSGHKATGSVIRAVEVDGEWVPRRFRTFSPCAVAMIGRLPGTLEDRAVPVQMRRALRGEVRRSFRPDRRDGLDPLRSKAARFAADHMTALAVAEPGLPPGAFNRFADNWRPLVALADLAGGKWPGRARAAILADLGAVDEADLGGQLLIDLREVFARIAPDQVASEDLVAGLKAIEDGPWNEVGKSERPITQNMLARLLREFDIRPGTIRVSEERARLTGKPTAKGYKRADFAEAWARYIPAALEPAKPTVTPSQPRKSAAHSDSATVARHPSMTVAESPKAAENLDCDGVTVGKGCRRER
jgi:hypothetical protein